MLMEKQNKTLSYWIIKIISMTQALEHLLLRKEIGGAFKPSLKLMNFTRDTKAHEQLEINT